jgi:hypothetical protein
MNGELCHALKRVETVVNERCPRATGARLDWTSAPGGSAEVTDLEALASLATNELVATINLEVGERGCTLLTR